MMDFLHGRAAELSKLDRCVQSARNGDPQLVVLFGRRRVGKTFLLHHALARLSPGESAYHACSYLSVSDELASLWNEMRASGRVGPEEPAPKDLDSFLAKAAELAKEQLLVVALDEFPYLIQTSKRIPAAVQRFWDRLQSTNQRTKLVIVLTGSAVSTMSKVIASGGPLFERPTLLIRLDPFDLPTSASFLGITLDSSPSELRAVVEARAACGGYPLLLRKWNIDLPGTENLRLLATDPLAPLVTMSSVLLLDLPDDRGLRATLGAIGRGFHKQSDIQNLTDQRVDAAISILEGGGFVLPHVSAGEKAAKGASRKVFRIADAHLRFYFAMIEPYRQLIEAGQGTAVLSASNERWVSVVAQTFEADVRASAVRMVSDGRLPEGLLIDEWWTDRPTQAQLDVVAIDGASGEWRFAGEAKWTNRFSGHELRAFEKNLAAAGNRALNVRRAIWVGDRSVVDLPIGRETQIFDTRDLLS